MILVSVHLPKTAGSSFREVLKGHFGEKMLLDYGDMPINTPREKRNAKALADAKANETTASVTVWRDTSRATILGEIQENFRRKRESGRHFEGYTYQIKKRVIEAARLQ